MVKLKIQFLLSFLLILPFGIFCQTTTSQSSAKILTSDLELLVGNWEGTLTYLDYSTNEPYTMPANLTMRQGKNELQIKGTHVYPSEPKANSTFKLKISENGYRLNKREVASRVTMPDGQIQITTEHLHKDGNENKMAVNRITYTIGSEKYSVRKDIQFVGSSDWIKRNEYKYEKIKSN